MNRVFCLGMGPGSAAYVLPEVLSRAQGLPVLLGEARFQGLIPPGPRREPFSRGTSATLERVATLLLEGDVGVLVSGDPCFFSMGSLLTNRFGTDRVVLVPGISCLQILAARIGRSWQAVTTLSLHGRDLGKIQDEPAGEAVVLLGGRLRVPTQLQGLVARGWGKRWGVLAWDLGQDGERLFYGTLEDLAKEPPWGSLPLLWVYAFGEKNGENA